MELRQVQYFLAVAEELHFGRAAERLHIGQPAISQQIRRLERELNVQLFDRSSRNVELTEHGCVLLDYARDLVSAAESFAIQARRLTGEEENVFRIGISSALGARLDDFLDALSVSGLDARLDFRALPVRERMAELRAGRLDAAFIRGVSSAPGLRLLTLWQDNLVVALPASHSLAGKPSLNLVDLANVPLHIIPRNVNPSLYDVVITACARAGFVPVMGRPFTDLQHMVADLSSGGNGWTLLYRAAADSIMSRRIAVRSLDKTPVSVRMSLAFRENIDPQRYQLLAEACRRAKLVETETTSESHLLPSASGVGSVSVQAPVAGPPQSAVTVTGATRETGCAGTPTRTPRPSWPPPAACTATVSS